MSHGDSRRTAGWLRAIDPITLGGAVALLLVLIGAWWLFSASVSPLLYPSPIRVVTALVEMTRTGELGEAVASTAFTFGIGLGSGVLVGLVLGLLVAESRVAGSIVNPIATALYATPVIVMVPLVIIWFGVDVMGRIFVVFLGTVIPMYINAEAGFRSARRDLVEVARSFGARRGTVLRDVTLPGAVPFIMTGLKIAVGRALGSVVVAEIFLDLSGLGGLIQTSVGLLRVDKMIAAALILALAGALLMFLTNRLESRFDAWRSAR
jgi:NitT/TauT family transport system permease protein